MSSVIQLDNHRLAKTTKKLMEIGYGDIHSLVMWGETTKELDLDQQYEDLKDSLETLNNKLDSIIEWLEGE